ncbi:MAG: hypothetical protein K0Q54_3937 [Methylobacterium brachiatum]|jgi:hypothetical protein|nr:hypothetical protein [Methylobacterium brachiatum]
MDRPASQAGSYRIAELVAGQCRFACTPHTARPDAHRFCGAPVAWKAGKPTAWCPEHLARVYDTPGRAPVDFAVAVGSAAQLVLPHAPPTRPSRDSLTLIAEVER